MNYLYGILLLSFLILVHELGHFLTAKLFGIQVNEFSLFMGPALAQKQLGSTLYSIRCIPLGGYCALEGEEEDTGNPRSFQRAVWWKQLIVLCAGVAMNFLVGSALFLGFFSVDRWFVMPTVAEVDPLCSFAGPEGIRAGDRILELDGERVYVQSDFSLILSLNPGQIHDLVVERDGERLELKGLNMERREFPNEDGTVSKRFGFSFSVVEATPMETLRYTWNNVRDSLRMVRLSLNMLVTGKAGVEDVSGPVGIVREIATVTENAGSAYYAFLNLLYFGGFLSLNLAVMNLLPIPALDGGRVVGVLLTTLIRRVTGKKPRPEIEAYIHAAGMVVLLIFMGLIIFKDIFFAIKR